MRIDEFEFQDRNGNEIEPTKNQLVVYIKSLHKQIAELKKQLEEIQDFIKLYDCDNFEEFKSFIGSCHLTPAEKEIAIVDLQKQLESKDRQINVYAHEIAYLDIKLHSQPKEIVEKVKEQLIKRLNTIAGYGRMTTDELSFLIEAEFGSDLDTILKEYQK